MLWPHELLGMIDEPRQQLPRRHSGVLEAGQNAAGAANRDRGNERSWSVYKLSQR